MNPLPDVTAKNAENSKKKRILRKPNGYRTYYFFVPVLELFHKICGRWREKVFPFLFVFCAFSAAKQISSLALSFSARTRSPSLYDPVS